MKKIILVPALVLLCSGLAQAETISSLVIDYEEGPLAILRNDGRYGPNGTGYSAATVGQGLNLYPSQRISAEATWGPHTGILLYAPLDLTTRAQLADPLVFRSTAFPAGEVIDSRYLFEGYRGSYLYRLLETPAWKAWLGGTLQIRNAQVAFSTVSGTKYVAESDIGLVPALKGRLRYDAPSGFYGMMEMDGLSSFGLFNVKGGILDAALTLGIPVNSQTDALLRLRYLTGGADVPSRNIYNWGNFLAATAGLRINLR